MSHPERLAFLGLVTLTLAPVVCHGLWRPSATLLGATGGDAAWMTLAALGVACSVLVAFVVKSSRKPWLAGLVGSGVGVILGILLGGDLPGRLAATATLVGVGVVIGALVTWLSNRLPDSLDGLAARYRVTTLLYVLMAALCIVQTARVSTFIGDPARSECQAIPGDPFLARHSCLTAYVHAASLAHARAENVYDASHWPDLSSGPDAAYPNLQRRYGPFDLDAFAYPPPFLLLPSTMHLLDGRFAAQRALWFGASGLFLAACLWTVARWLGASGGHRALLLTPLVWLSLPVLVSLQVGNVHVSVLAACMIAMIAFQKGRPIVGGALLSFCILSKLSPGVLAVWLLLQRRWRDAAWTAGFGLGWIALSAAVFGTEPLKQFVQYQVPRLGSGEALAFMAKTPGNILINLAPFGIPFRLSLLGISLADPWAMARGINLVFTVVVVAVTVLAGLRRTGMQQQACTWLALLTLAAFRSPFAPGYVMASVLWLLSLLALEARSTRAVAAIASSWILWSLPPPLPQTAAAAFGLLPITLVLMVSTWVALRRPLPGLTPVLAGEAATTSPSR